MRLFRSLSIAVAGLTTVASVAAMAPAGAAEPGLGTAATTTKLVSAAVGANGSLLNVNLISDEGRSTIDSAVAAPSSFSRLTVADISSGIVSALNVKLPVPPLEAKAPEGPLEATLPAADLLPASVPAVIGTGTIDAPKLTASLVDGVAKSSLTAGVSNVTAAMGGLLAIDKIGTTQGTTTNVDAAEAVRNATVGNITVLDLDQLLSGLGIQLPDLSVAQVAGLVDALGATAGLNLPSGQTTLTGAIDVLDDTIAGLQTQLGGATDAALPVTATVDSATSTLLGTLGLDSNLFSTTTTVTTTVGEVNDLITDVRGLLNSLIAGGVNTLATAPLLRLEGVEVGVTASAVDTVEASKAAVVGKVGAVKVGGLTLPGVDLLGEASKISALVTDVQNKINGVLSVVSPDLAGVVKVSVLDKVESVTASGGYVRSRAGVTGATATVTPPAALQAILDTIDAQVDTVMNRLGATAVAQLGLSGTMNQLGSTLSLGMGALSQGATVRVAEVLSASDFRRPGVTPGAPVTPTTPELPRTGGPAQLALLGGMAAVLALGLRRFLHQPAVRVVRTK